MRSFLVLVTGHIFIMLPGILPPNHSLPTLPLEQVSTPVLPGELHGQRGLEGNSPWSRKESDTTKRLTLSLINLLFLQKEKANSQG